MKTGAVYKLHATSATGESDRHRLDADVNYEVHQKRGGLNGSTQHFQLRPHIQMKTKLKALTSGLDQPEPYLARKFGHISPNRSILQGKHFVDQLIR